MRIKAFWINSWAICGLFALIPFSAQADNDFPTLDRVEYVLGCMNQNGGENYDNLYRCVCAIDYLRSQFNYDEYSQAQVFRMLRSTPGEIGGVFRDPEKSDVLRDKLDAADEVIAKRCFFNAQPKS